MSNKFKGAIFIILGVLSYALMYLPVKYLVDIPLMQKVFYRNLVPFIISSIIMAKQKQSFKVKCPWIIALRSISGYLALIFNFYAIAHLLLADATILKSTNPFYIILFSIVFLREPFKKHFIITLILAFVGAILVIKPQFNYSVLPSIAGLGAGMFSGAAYCTVKYLTGKEEPETIIFYFTGASSLFTLPFLLGGQYVSPSPQEWIGLISIGIFATIAQFFITYGYSYAPASELSIYNYAQIIFTILLGLIFWREVPDLLSLIGGSLIMIAGYINYQANREKRSGVQLKVND